MKTIIDGIEEEATCSLSGKKGECFILRSEDGEPRPVATSRVLEILRWNAAVANGNGPPASSPRAPARATSGGET